MVSGADSWHHLTTLYSDLVDLRPIANAGDTVQRYVKKGMTYSNFIGMSCLRGVRKKFNAKMKVWWWKCWSYWWYCCCLIHTSPQSRHHFFQQQQPKQPKLIVGDGCGGNCWNHGNNSGAFADIFFLSLLIFRCALIAFWVPRTLNCIAVVHITKSVSHPQQLQKSCIRL